MRSLKKFLKTYLRLSFVEKINMAHPRTDLKNFDSAESYRVPSFKTRYNPRSVLGWVVAIFLLVPSFAYAQVFISEIKYTGNEWIEISNNGEAVDISLWKFFEGDTNHKLKSVQGGATIAGGAYAIIANDPVEFLKEYSGFTGILFDSSFSLLDVGETISIKSSDATTVDTVSYTGIKGSKNSTQKINGVWREAAPTPGVTNGGTLDATVQELNTNTAQTNTTQNNLLFPVEPQIFASIKSNTRTTLVGAPITFTSKVFGLKKEPIENARSLWSFGDGAYKEGESVTHTYYYPGEYTVVLDATSGYFSASNRLRVMVSVPDIVLVTGGDDTRSFVSVENRSADEIDLSNWQIFSDSKTFIFPKNTFLPARRKVLFASEVTGLSTPLGTSAELRFPNGERVPLGSDAKELPIEIMPPQRYEEISSSPERIEKNIGATNVLNQQASVAEAVDYTNIPNESNLSGTKEPATKSLMPWYIGIAFMGAFALLTLRFTRRDDESKRDESKGKDDNAELSADDFEIIEEK